MAARLPLAPQLGQPGLLREASAMVEGEEAFQQQCAIRRRQIGRLGARQGKKLILAAPGGRSGQLAQEGRHHVEDRARLGDFGRQARHVGAIARACSLTHGMTTRPVIGSV